MATCFASIVAVVGIVILVWQVWEAKRALRVNTCSRLFEFWMGERWERKRLLLTEVIRPVRNGECEPPASFDELVARVEKARGENSREDTRQALWPVCDFFEHLGVLVRYGAMDISILEEYWRGIVPAYWEVFEGITSEYREKRGDPLMLENFERLYRKLKDC
jgi:hypothetical protein